MPGRQYVLCLRMVAFSTCAVYCLPGRCYHLRASEGFARGYQETAFQADARDRGLPYSNVQQFKQLNSFIGQQYLFLSLVTRQTFARHPQSRKQPPRSCRNPHQNFRTGRSNGNNCPSTLSGCPSSGHSLCRHGWQFGDRSQTRGRNHGTTPAPFRILQSPNKG